MSPALPNRTSLSFETKRINALYANTTSSLISLAVGVALAAVVLAPTANPAILKPWVVYMLSVLTLRVCLWFMHRSSAGDTQSARRWEFGYAFTMLLAGIGWGALSGPLYPESTLLQVFVLVLTLITAFSGAVYSAVSRLSFILFALPTIVPSTVRYVLTIDPNYQLLGFIACFVGAFVLVNVHHALARFAIRQLRHEVEIEALLVEQEAIFQTVTAGIVIVRNGKPIKCNTRLGEILGRSLKDIQSMPLTQLLTNTTDVDAIMAATVAALKDGKPVYALHRMRHANGSEFWAELSGRRMRKDSSGDMIWLINDVGQRDRRSSDTSAQPDQENAVRRVSVS